MQQKIIVSTAADIKNIAHEMGLFHTQKRTIKVHLSQLSEEENRRIENRIVKQYAANDFHQSNVFGINTLMGYVLLVATNIIPVIKLGITNAILLYVFFSIAVMLIVRVYNFWHARRELMRLAEELPGASSLGYL